MATVDDYGIVAQIIGGEGFYPGDEHAPVGPVVRVTEYRNFWGGITYGIVYRSEARAGQLDKYQHETEYVVSPRVIWELPPERWGSLWRPCSAWTSTSRRR